MKKFLTILFLIFSLSVNAQITDKQLHLFVGTTIGAWSYVIGNNTSKTQFNGNPIQFKAIIYGVSGATMAGLTKETWDWSRGKKFDVKDLGATVLGGVASVILITGVKWIFKRR
jgi:uncharacterized membrane protein YeaQ/YmgE (transglycosylase-associated protein family)